MELKHIKIFGRNPDSKFHPEIEVQNHQKLTKEFLQRFEEVHKDFHTFTLSVRKAGKK